MLTHELTYQKMLDRLRAKEAVDINNVIKAYELAASLHKGQMRKDGKPYISHPIEVAYILTKMDFDTNVIAGALLHDVIEDCGYTAKEIEKNFNTTIAKIVDGVTAIEGDFDNLSDEEFPKLFEEVKTYQKLIAVGKENLFAFYIKFADRLHNLSTISCFPHYKQMAKVKETEKWLYPILKLLNANEFLRLIANESFKIQNSDTIDELIRIYNKYFDYNQEVFGELKETLTLLINNYQRKKNEKIDLQRISLKPCTELETYNLIADTMDVKRIQDVKQSFLNKFPITKLVFVFNNNKSAKELNNFLFNFLSDSNTKKLIKIAGFGIEKETKAPYVIVVDSFRNKYQLYIFTSKNYLIYKNGTTIGVDLSFVDENIEELSDKYIHIRSRSNEVFRMPEHSTVLDFAFKIHKDLGFACKFAYLNDAPTKSPIYTKLSDGDKVTLVIEKDENGVCQNISQIRWVMYAKTELAQRSLVRYFENIM